MPQHTPARTHARTHAHTHARTHATLNKPPRRFIGFLAWAASAVLAGLDMRDGKGVIPLPSKGKAAQPDKAPAGEVLQFLRGAGTPSGAACRVSTIS